MAIVRIPGKARRFVNTETGEEMSRRQADKILGRIERSYEDKAAKNKKEDLIKSLSRPARGRKKINPVENFEEAESRVFNERLKKVRTKKINGRLLVSGHLAERVNFFTYDQYVDLMGQMKNERAPNGQKLITFYGIGATGHSIRMSDFGKVLAATIVPMQTTDIVYSEDEFESIINDWLSEHDYFEIDYFWLHLHFNKEYAIQRIHTLNKRKADKRLKQLGLK